MSDGQSSNHGGEQLPCRQQIGAIFLRSAKRKLVSLELRANHLPTSAIRKRVGGFGWRLSFDEGEFVDGHVDADVDSWFVES